MSVILFTQQEMGKIAKSLVLLNSQYGNPGKFWKFLNFHEELEAKYWNITQEEIDKYTENKILCFLDRLYIANQLAYMYTYSDAKNMILRLEEKDVKEADTLPRMQLLNLLRSLRYNLISNSGHTFLDPIDKKKLDILLENLTWEAFEALEPRQTPCKHLLIQKR